MTSITSPPLFSTSMRRASPGPPRQSVMDGRAPVPTSEATSKVMRANRGRDTGPELALRWALRAAGLSGYRTHPKGLPGRPDLVLSKVRIAVFVHGCFWHRCQRCDLPLPKSNARYWQEKFDRNVERDSRKGRALRAAGYHVLTIWECQLKSDPAKCVERVRSAVSRRQ